MAVEVGKEGETLYFRVFYEAKVSAFGADTSLWLLLTNTTYYV